MKLIDDPQTLAQRIVNAICADIYGRSGGDHFFDGIDEDVVRRELIPELTAVVQREIDGGMNVLLQCVECHNTESPAGALTRYFNRGRCLRCGGAFKVTHA